jgi:methionyl-tRNA formyltransferase
MKILLMADKYVGDQITRWLLHNYHDDVGAVVTVERNNTYTFASDSAVPCTVIDTIDRVLDIEFDLGILAWWPSLVSKAILKIPRMGLINTHPSLLPYNRGKHYNFWAIVEQVPFGVSLHMVGNGIDDGPVIAQKEIEYGWEDTGETLYDKAQDAMVKLFINTYPYIRGLDFTTQPQDLTKGSFHWGKELDDASRISIEGRYIARDLLNMLRARTFEGHPACWFEDGGETYEVRVDIRRKQ